MASVAFRLNVVATAACRPANRISIDVRYGRLCAKVVLRWGSKILRAVDAPFAQRCEGPHRLTLNSRATSVTRVRLYESAMASRFVFREKFALLQLATFATQS